MMKRTPPNNLFTKRQDTAPSRQEMKLMKYRNQGQNHERKTGIRMGFARGTCWLQLAIIFVLSLCMAERSWALDIEYCSGINTATGSAMTNLYQSHGLCHDHCVNDYAFAVLQGTRCWCSNYAPTTNTTGCDTGCPGYDLEYCGSTTDDLFGYIPLVIEVSGTLSAAPSSTVRPSSIPPQTTDPPASSSEPPDPTPLPTPSPSISTIVEESPGQTTTVTIVSTTSTTSTTSQTSSTITTARTTSSPSLSVVTTVGGFRTVTLAPTDLASTQPSSVATPSATSVSEEDSGFFSNPGRVAGLVVGLILGVAAVVALVLFIRHRRKRQQSMYGDSGSGIIQAGGAGFVGGGSNRRRSRSLSTLGLVGEKGLGTADSTPASGHQYSSSTASGPLMDGTSAPIGRIIDQRLDPYIRFDNDPSSRMSVKSLRDDQDYSRRVLRLANPDEE